MEDLSKGSSNNIFLCEHCINAIKSHCEKLLVGDVADEGSCEFCGDVDELRECCFELDVPDH